jgi:hypothetical protein
VPENSQSFEVIEERLTDLKELAIGVFFFSFTFLAPINLIYIHVLGFKGIWTWEEGEFQGDPFLSGKGRVFGALCKPNASGTSDSVLRGNAQRDFGKPKLSTKLAGK